MKTMANSPILDATPTREPLLPHSRITHYTLIASDDLSISNKLIIIIMICKNSEHDGSKIKMNEFDSKINLRTPK